MKDADGSETVASPELEPEAVAVPGAGVRAEPSFADAHRLVFDRAAFDREREAALEFVRLNRDLVSVHGYGHPDNARLSEMELIGEPPKGIEWFARLMQVQAANVYGLNSETFQML